MRRYFLPVHRKRSGPRPKAVFIAFAIRLVNVEEDILLCGFVSNGQKTEIFTRLRYYPIVGSVCFIVYDKPNIGTFNKCEPFGILDRISTDNASNGKTSLVMVRQRKNDLNIMGKITFQSLEYSICIIGSRQVYAKKKKQICYFYAVF